MSIGQAVLVRPVGLKVSLKKEQSWHLEKDFVGVANFMQFILELVRKDKCSVKMDCCVCDECHSRR